jgi:cation transporter-like permease
MKIKQAVRSYRDALAATAIASGVLLATFTTMLWRMPALAALDPATATEVLSILVPATLTAFAMPIIHHARAVHGAVAAGLRIGRLRNGLRAFRLYRHAVPAVARRRHKCAA